MTENESQVESPGKIVPGDSNVKRKAQPIQCYRWCFTLKAHNKEGELIEPRILYENLKPFCKEFYYQHEEGDEKKENEMGVIAGYEHYQGCLSLIIKERYDNVKNIIGYNNVYVDDAKYWYKLKNYCKKKNTRVNGPWSHESVWIETIQNLYWWQEAILEELQGPIHPRKIYWVWEEHGNRGKSVFCKYLAVRHSATILDSAGFKDIAQALPEQPRIIVFDFARSMDGKINYRAIEKCKDGMMFSGKYESKMKIFNIPHVICFANWKPDIEAMSKDRWEIIEL